MQIKKKNYDKESKHNVNNKFSFVNYIYIYIYIYNIYIINI